MPASQDIEFIVIATTKVGENSLVLHTLSEDYGRRSFIVRVGKSNSLYLPLNIIEAHVQENPKSDLWRLTSAKAMHPLFRMRSNVAKNAIALFISEVLYRAIRSDSNEAGLYRWCRNSILTLDSLESDYASFHLHFLLDLCAVLGFRPDISDLAPFAGEYFETLSRLLPLDYGEFLLYPLNGKVRSDIASILLNYLSYHLDCRLNIRSLEVLKELFA